MHFVKGYQLREQPVPLSTHGECVAGDCSGGYGRARGSVKKNPTAGAGISGENTRRDMKPAFLEPFDRLFLSSMPPLTTTEPQPARTPETGRRRSPPSRGNVPEDQQPGTTIDISADPSSARMPTYIDTNAEPVLSLLYIFILFSSLLSISGAPLPACPSDG